eukprot:CAMPEP_0185782702 /NCGR_PEP_ID=MMETSP1174-20130828/111127_1 /TAXON_ID=35687 /ORGANISM="Dictyocha speculum, Strain CCMP1381" /LENGTH=64 /DNA_ID=CAMNT_0028473335 /DNA_START=498 /DNA_END=692 /DNA_ORIENTATION=+
MIDGFKIGGTKDFKAVHGSIYGLGVYTTTTSLVLQYGTGGCDGNVVLCMAIEALQGKDYLRLQT